MTDLLHTPLYPIHMELGARMMPFAGYAMPLHYPTGTLKEHLHTRNRTGLFDVSHMGQVCLHGSGVAERLETLVPMDIIDLPIGRQRYGFFTNEAGGILDDCMIANRGNEMLVVFNAACKADDITRLRHALGKDMTPLPDHAFLALQGPESEKILDALSSNNIQPLREMRFMDAATITIGEVDVWVSRSGYSGEDGFEISVPAAHAAHVFCTLLSHDDVLPVGLGARDSLRLEAGLCLYGHDIDAHTTPVEAALDWAIPKVRRREGARAGGFPGTVRILEELSVPPAGREGRRRVGLRPAGRAPMREGVRLFATSESATAIGVITSGGFGPSIDAPIAMGYVPTALAVAGTVLWGESRGARERITVTSLPFVPTTFRR